MVVVMSAHVELHHWSQLMQSHTSTTEAGYEGRVHDGNDMNVIKQLQPPLVVVRPQRQPEPGRFGCIRQHLVIA